MKTDAFTKVVLTIIAVNLTLFTITNLELFPKAYANNPLNTLESGPYKNYGLVPINEDGTISVKIDTHNQLDVNIVGVNTSDELDINIDEIGGAYVSHGGPLKVEVD